MKIIQQRTEYIRKLEIEKLMWLKDKKNLKKKIKELERENRKLRTTNLELRADTF